MISTLNGVAFIAVAVVTTSIESARSMSAGSRTQAPNTTAAIAAAAQFHEFLARGDSARAVGLLAPDAVVLESGDRETRAEYIAHHLGEDIEFARAVPTTRTVVDSRRQGDVVWVVATSTTKGKWRDRQIDSRGAELMVLSRSGKQWLLRAIHWSSHRAAP